MADSPFGPFDELAVRQDLDRRRLLQLALAAGATTAAGLALAACGGSSSAVSSTTVKKATEAAAKKAGVVLQPGTRPFPDRPEGTDTLPQVEHIIVYMQENHSYDSYFASLPRGDGLLKGGKGTPAAWNLDKDGTKVVSFHQADTCKVITGDHGWNATHTSVNGGKMDGFVKASGQHVMGYYDQTNLPFYHGLAMTFPLCDRWFASVPGPTHPNRRYLIAGTSSGLINTDVGKVMQNPVAANGTIFDRLDAHGITWKDYAIDVGDVFLYPGKDLGAFLSSTQDNRASFADFMADCRNGSLPAVSFIGPGTAEQYDEGSQDSRNGEAYSAAIVNAVMDSPLWEKSAIFISYDEHGGAYDHVPPPAAIAPDDVAPMTAPGDAAGTFNQYGVRVPAMVVSPFSKKNYVSHTVRDHTAVLKFLETKWNLGALTLRDANADNLMDCFDFSKTSFAEPPQLPAAALATATSECQPQPRPELNPQVRPRAASKS